MSCEPILLESFCVSARRGLGLVSAPELRRSLGLPRSCEQRSEAEAERRALKSWLRGSLKKRLDLWAKARATLSALAAAGVVYFPSQIRMADHIYRI